MFGRILRSLRTNVLVGFILIVPVVATILIFNFLFKLATNWLPASAFPGLATIWNGYLLRTLTLVAVVIAFYLIGLLIRNFLGRKLYRLGDRILTSIPLIKNVYLSIRQISESIFAQRKTLLKEVVLIEYPRKGLFSLAFVTATAPPSVAEKMGTDEPCVSLFISTTPNPTSGVFIMAPKSELIPLNISVGDALTFIMSSGAVSPSRPGDKPESLIDKIEEWLEAEGKRPPSEASR